MLEHLNIQAIAKWFEKGCDSLDNSSTNKNDKGFYILECNDICLLSKLADVKNKTLQDRACKRLKKIKDPISRKDFLLTICSEFLRDGRRAISLKMITNEIENETELFRMFQPDLMFHRALCYFKLDKPAEALCDLYSAFGNSSIQSLDKIHVQILEEIKKCLKNNKFKDGHILTNNNCEVTFEQILQQYESEICRFIKQQMEKQKNEQQEQLRQQQEQQQQQQQQTPPPIRRTNYRQERAYNQTQFPSYATRRNNIRNSVSYRSGNLQPSSSYSKFKSASSQSATVSARAPNSYKGKLPGPNNPSSHSNNSNGYISGSANLAPVINNNNAHYGASNNKSYYNGNNKVYIKPVDTNAGSRVINNNFNKYETANSKVKEIALAYSVDNQKQISIKQILNEPIIDNIFKLRAILVDNLVPDYKVNTICEIFQTFGTIVNIKYKENSDKLIIEYDNADSPRYAISYLSQIELPYVTANNKNLEFRFYKSENQKNLRICKQNQIKTSRECYFWRTTGCQNTNCRFYHNRLAKGVDYQEWMKSEHFSRQTAKTNGPTGGATAGGVNSGGGDSGPGKGNKPSMPAATSSNYKQQHFKQQQTFSSS